MRSNIISLKEYREEKIKKLDKQKLYYMDKADLLDELIQYCEAIKKDPYDIQLALWGEDLMEVISERALTKELFDLVDSYQKNGAHKIFQLEQQIDQSKSS